MSEAGVEELPKGNGESRVKLIGEAKVPAIREINGDVIFDRVTDDRFNIDLGNTGLSLRFTERDGADKYEISADFIPNRFCDPGYVSPLTATQIFCYGLSQARDWLRSSDLIDRSKIDKIKSVTNPAFARFIDKFFGNNRSGVVSSISLDKAYVEMDLGRFLEIPDDDPLVQKIEKLAKRAEGMKVRALVPETAAI